MKMKSIFNHKWLLGAAALVLGFTAVSCEDEPDKFEQTKGTPQVLYIRPANPELADSLLTGAYLNNLICIVGNNLTSIHEIYFNDQKAVINTSYLTANTLLVNVPSSIPEVVTNKIYMKNTAGVTTEYDFKVLVPAPSVRSASCEWAAPGEEVTIIGDYFIDEPSVPLTVSFAGNVQIPRENITSITKTAIKFIVPDNYTAGYINVSTIYGTSRSAFRFHDTTNILFDWDGLHGGHTSGYGWRNGVIHTPGSDEGIEAIDGNYLYFGGKEMSGEVGATWDEDSFSFNYWPDASGENGPLCDRPEFAELIKKYGVGGLQLKFECLIPSSNPWSASSMQIVFAPIDLASSANQNNAYFSNTSLPRALWTPWLATGSYNTAGKWTTVTVPFSNFTYTHEGGSCSEPFTENLLAGLSFFIWNGGMAGTDCKPVVCIDNIRVVPVE